MRDVTHTTEEGTAEEYGVPGNGEKNCCWRRWKRGSNI